MGKARKSCLGTNVGMGRKKENQKRQEQTETQVRETEGENQAWRKQRRRLIEKGSVPKTRL